jgi:hypothetical protein
VSDYYAQRRAASRAMYPRVAASMPRWQQIRAGYLLWEAVGCNGVARLWRNEGASPGWGWQVLTDAGALVAGGMCDRRDDAEAAAFAVVGVCDE